MPLILIFFPSSILVTKFGDRGAHTAITAFKWVVDRGVNISIIASLPPPGQQQNGKEKVKRKKGQQHMKKKLDFFFFGKHTKRSEGVSCTKATKHRDRRGQEQKRRRNSPPSFCVDSGGSVAVALPRSGLKQAIQYHHRQTRYQSTQHKDKSRPN